MSHAFILHADHHSEARRQRVYVPSSAGALNRALHLIESLGVVCTKNAQRAIFI